MLCIFPYYTFDSRKKPSTFCKKGRRAEKRLSFPAGMVYSGGTIGRCAMVSKEKSPAIHFVIRHPKLRGAIENFVPPMVEE